MVDIQSIQEELDVGIPLVEIKDISLLKEEKSLPIELKNLLLDYMFFIQHKWRIQKRRNYFRNRRKLLDLMKDYYLEHKEAILEKQKSYYNENKTEILERIRKYQTEHKEAEKKRHQKYYKKHKRELKEKMRLYYLNHKDKWVDYDKTKLGGV